MVAPFLPEPAGVYCREVLAGFASRHPVREPAADRRGSGDAEGGAASGKEEVFDGRHRTNQVSPIWSKGGEATLALFYSEVLKDREDGGQTLVCQRHGPDRVRHVPRSGVGRPVFEIVDDW